MGFLTGVFKFALGGLLGAAVGAGVAVLIAPQSGEELKAKINERIAAGKQARAEAEAATRAAMEQEFRRKVNDENAFRSTPPNGTSASSTTQSSQ
jgi:gas vesicle protein